MKNEHILYVTLFILLATGIKANAQMKRQRADTPQVVDDAFWAPTLITQATTHHLSQGVLNVSIMHDFGIATEEPIQNFFGLDQIQNVRLGLDYAFTNGWSVGIGRSSLLNIIDLRTKIALLRQSKSNRLPLSLSLKADAAVVTQKNFRPFEDDLSLLASAIFSRKMTDDLSLQLIPMVALFSRSMPGNQTVFYALGAGAEYHLNKRFGLMVEHYAIVGERVEGTTNAFSIGLNIKTGGHVFQLFLASTRWPVGQFTLAQNENQFWAGDFRFGFNVNRVFSL